MKYEIIIETPCYKCCYMRKVERFYNCLLFDRDLYDKSGMFYPVEIENLDQCRQCKILVERHLKIPEVEMIQKPMFDTKALLDVFNANWEYEPDFGKLYANGYTPMTIDESMDYYEPQYDISNNGGMK